MRFSINGTRAFQISLLLLLIISAAQVSWWIVDQARRTEALRARLTELYTGDASAAEELHRLGADDARLKRLFPHLAVDTSGKIVVSPEALKSLRLQRIRWLNQYGWEGGFFLVVLVVSMVAVWRALQQDKALRRRQQNFVATVSHEFKSPLASLRLSAETLSLRELTHDRILKVTDRMTADVERMEDMVSKILDTSHLEQGRITLLSGAHWSLHGGRTRCGGTRGPHHNCRGQHSRRHTARSGNSRRPRRRSDGASQPPGQRSEGGCR